MKRGYDTLLTLMTVVLVGLGFTSFYFALAYLRAKEGAGPTPQAAAPSPHPTPPCPRTSPSPWIRW